MRGTEQKPAWAEHKLVGREELGRVHDEEDPHGADEALAIPDYVMRDFGLSAEDQRTKRRITTVESEPRRMESEFRRTEPAPARHAPRRVIASYDSYAEAQRAVDYLSDEGFPVERVSIVAEDLRFVEQVTGRRGYGQAALEGVGSGAVIGAFFGFFLGLFSPVDPLFSVLILVLYGLVFGGVIGAIISLIFHALSGGQRDFSSVGGIEADNYNVLVDEEVAEEASRLVQRLR